jgi:hypothetical protein
VIVAASVADAAVTAAGSVGDVAATVADVAASVVKTELRSLSSLKIHQTVE